MKNQIEESNAVLRAIKNIPNQIQRELAQLDGPSADPTRTIGHNTSYFLAYMECIWNK